LTPKTRLKFEGACLYNGECYMLAIYSLQDSLLSGVNMGK